MKLLIEIVAYAAFAGVVGVFSVWPDYELIEDDVAIISIVFSHAGDRVGECRQISQEELNKLPPNMRKPSECPRERHPVAVELRSGGVTLFKQTMRPSGIWSDGKSNVYQRMHVRVGQHDLFIGMEDRGQPGFRYTHETSVDLQPGRNLVIQFHEDTRTFIVR